MSVPFSLWSEVELLRPAIRQANHCLIVSLHDSATGVPPRRERVNLLHCAGNKGAFRLGSLAVLRCIPLPYICYVSTCGGPWSRILLLHGDSQRCRWIIGSPGTPSVLDLSGDKRLAKPTSAN